MKMTKLLLPLLILFTLAFTEVAYSTHQGDEAYLPFAPKMLEPEGGLEGIIKKIKYPPMAQQNKIEGKVYLLVYVNESGGVDDVKVVKGLGHGTDEAAIDAVKKTKFTPGEDKGQKVKVKLSIAITFKLK